MRQSRVRRCWAREVGLGEWIRWGRRKRRKPEERGAGVSKSDLLLTSVCIHDNDRSAIALERNCLQAHILTNLIRCRRARIFYVLFVLFNSSLRLVLRNMLLLAVSICWIVIDQEICAALH